MNDLIPNCATPHTRQTFISGSAVYGKYGDKIKAQRMAEAATNCLDIIKDKIPDFDTDAVSVLIRSFRHHLDHGDCTFVDQDEQVIRLNINVKSDDDFYKVLAHELIHCHQMQRGDLRITPDHAVWKGVEMKHILPTMNYNKYKKQPWEVEAWTNQDKLGEFLKLHSGSKKIVL